MSQRVCQSLFANLLRLTGKSIGEMDALADAHLQQTLTCLNVEGFTSVDSQLLIRFLHILC